MSDFPAALAAALEIEEISQVEFARLCDVDPATISVWLSGQTTPKLGSLRPIFAAFAHARGNVSAGIEVVLAFLRDAAHEAGIGVNQIVIAPAGLALPPGMVRVPEQHRELFATLAAGTGSPEIIEHLHTLAGLIHAHLAALADSTKLGEIVRGEFDRPAAVAEESAPYEVSPPLPPKKKRAPRASRPAPPLPGATG